MIQFKSDQGEISISSAVFSNITGMAATNCFGVKGMAYRSMTDGLVHLLRREAMSKGVSITYHDDNSIHALHANDVTRRHMHLTHAPSIAIDAVEEAPSPISKVVFSAPEEEMHALYAYVQTLPWFGEYEIVQSSPLLMELTVRGANKGGMAARLIELLHIAPENFYCIGDHANDIPMLRLAHIPFAPANAIAPVRQVPGIRVLPDCRENALAEMIRQLGELY